MSASTKLGDEFLCTPKLDVSGSNWVIFKDRFIWALDARGILDHVDGTGNEPANPISEEDRNKAKGVLTTEDGMEEGYQGVEPRRSSYETTNCQLYLRLTVHES